MSRLSRVIAAILGLLLALLTGIGELPSVAHAALAQAELFLH